MERYEKEQKDKFESEKLILEKEQEEEMRRERQAFLDSQNEKSESYQAIIKNLEDLKVKVKEYKNK